MLHALNPVTDVTFFFLEYKTTVSFIALGAVVLSITGVEALYADMGHFGKFPIRGVVYRVIAVVSAELLWSGRVLLKHPEAIKTPSSCWRRTGR